jgi:hypothetical protein
MLLAGKFLQVSSCIKTMRSSRTVHDVRVVRRGLPLAVIWAVQSSHALMNTFFLSDITRYYKVIFKQMLIYLYGIRGFQRNVAMITKSMRMLNARQRFNVKQQAVYQDICACFKIAAPLCQAIVRKVSFVDKLKTETDRLAAGCSKMFLSHSARLNFAYWN